MSNRPKGSEAQNRAESPKPSADASAQEQVAKDNEALAELTAHEREQAQPVRSEYGKCMHDLYEDGKDICAGLEVLSKPTNRIQLDIVLAAISKVTDNLGDRLWERMQEHPTVNIDPTLMGLLIAKVPEIFLSDPNYDYNIQGHILMRVINNSRGAET